MRAPSTRDRSEHRVAVAALACGVLGVLGAYASWWLVAPGLVLGIAATALGWRARRCGSREQGSVAITLGVVAVLLVPAFHATADDAERWGRDCALDPEHDPNC
jgi:hypothetical protein